MDPISFKRHRFPAEVIRHSVWLYARFTLSFRDVEELLAERGLDISYSSAFRALGLSAEHVRGLRSNNRAEISHQPVRRRERNLQRFKSPGSAQRFLSIHTATYNTFYHQRHLNRRPYLKELRAASFKTWRGASATAWPWQEDGSCLDRRSLG